MGYTIEEGKLFVKTAREVIEYYLKYREIIYPEEIKRYEEKRGVFTTLKIGNELRGCIGFPRPIYPLYKSLVLSAIAAATEDPRFEELKLEELNKITIEVSILTEPELIEVKSPEEYLDKIEIGKDGLLLEYGIYSGLFLPEVPIEENWDKIQYLSYLCLKAGLEPDCWLKYKIKLYKFQTQIFREKEPNGEVEEVILRKI